MPPAGSNLRSWLRKPLLSPLSYEGLGQRPPWWSHRPVIPSVHVPRLGDLRSRFRRIRSNAARRAYSEQGVRGFLHAHEGRGRGFRKPGGKPAAKLRTSLSEC
jgi:hypothetical protein